jgi:hypothetical protein
MARTVIIVVVLPLRLLNMPGQGSTGLRPFLGPFKTDLHQFDPISKERS